MSTVVNVMSPIYYRCLVWFWSLVFGRLWGRGRCDCRTTNSPWKEICRLQPPKDTQPPMPNLRRTPNLFKTALVGGPESRPGHRLRPDMRRGVCGMAGIGRYGGRSGVGLQHRWSDESPTTRQHQRCRRNTAVKHILTSNGLRNGSGITTGNLHRCWTRLVVPSADTIITTLASSVGSESQNCSAMKVM